MSDKQWPRSDDGLNENARELIDAENRHVAQQDRQEAARVDRQPDTEEEP